MPRGLEGPQQAVVIIAHNLSKRAINAYCGGYTALHWCCVTGIDAACGFLAKKGADASLRAEPDGETCLYKAATYSHTPCVDILLDAGCDANATNSDGATAFLACAASGRLRLARLAHSARRRRPQGGPGGPDAPRASRRKRGTSAACRASPPPAR